MRTQTYTGTMEPRIGYVELRVSELERSIAFYQQFIGFQLLERKEHTAKLTADGKTAQLLLKEEESFVERPSPSTGLFHFAINVPSRMDLALSLKHLIQEKYPVQGAADHHYSEAVYLADPDNNGIEIYTDRKSSLWKRDENGRYIGVTDPLDVDSLLAGVNEKEWKGLPADSRIGHMHLQAAGLEESEKFYVDTLGFEIVTQNAQMLFVSKDAYHHHIGMNTWAGKGLPAPPEQSLGLTCFTVHFTEAEYRSAKENLGNAGYNYSEDDQVITVKDPAGIRMKFIMQKN